jgi:hypothetical protein
MRTFIIPLVAVAGLIGLAVPVQAAPVAPHDLSVASPEITMVRQRCGAGMKREKGWRDKQGAWHGRCVPKRR